MINLKNSYILAMLLSAGVLCAQIPASRTMDWSKAGVVGGIPTFSATVNFLNNGGVAGNTSFDNSVPLQALVNSKAGTNTVIYFPPGTYRFKQKINIPAAGKIIIRGAGADSTKFEFETGAINTGNFEVWGGVAATYNVVSGATKNSTQLVLSGTAGLAVNDWIDISQDNDSLLMWTNNPTNALTEGPRSVGQVMKITAVSGNTITLDRPLHYTYNMTLNVRVTECIMAKRIGFENFTIESVTSGAKHHFLMVYSVNCWIKCVSSIKSDITHVNPNYTANLTIRDSYFHEAWEYGGGGHGGGVCFSMHSTDCLVENNVFDKLRHAMLVQRGANGNVFGYNFSINSTSSGTVSQFTRLPDGSLHGHFPYMNLYEGNVMQEIHSADHWGPSGPGNTFFRNRVCREGIRISDRSIDQNLVGNDLRKDASAAFTSNVINNESGVINTLIHGNKVGGNVSWDAALGSNNIINSYYLTSAPAFFKGAQWPSLGPESQYGSGTIPAEERYNQGFNTECEIPLSAASTDVQAVSPGNPLNQGCATTISPQLVIKNLGAVELTKATVDYRVDNGSLVSRTYTFSAGNGLQPGKAMGLQGNPSTVTSGPHTLKIWSTLPNSVADTDPANDTLTSTFTVVSAGQALSFTEDFESVNPGNIPSGWSRYNRDAVEAWFVYGTATNKAAAFNNHAYTGAQNEPDELALPPLNLTGSASAWLTFDLCHASRPAPTIYDSLEVLISTNCGQTFTSVWGRGGTALNTVPASANLFIPSGPQDYQNIQVDLSAYTSSNKAIVKFVNWSNNGNSTLIDHVNLKVTPTTYIPENNSSVSVNAFPLPAVNAVSVNAQFAGSSEVRLELVNLLGERVMSEIFVLKPDGKFDHRLDVSKLVAGVYYMQLIPVTNGTGSQSAVKKIIIAR